ncbi:hypothetical protein H0E87_013122 [Populus deltoides]|uniref:UNC93-like protein 3 n=1 Tax=Populus deltoides TaxID=3696 RepID=A0A8T2YLS4_POPDE|nr:hypothetical protein H0E87_013122 [Populus deltoides]
MASMDNNRDEEEPFVAAAASVDNSETLRNHTKDVHILSSAFLLIFLAYGAAQNLETTLNTKDDMGTISLGILYVSFTFFSLIASSVVRFMGSKNAVLLGTSGYWLFIAANLKPTWYTMVPASLYLGFAASIIWVGQGTYLTSTARSQARDYHLHEGTVIGNFNGEFWGMFASHQFVGNLISLAILRNGTEGSTTGTTLLFTVFLCSMTLGTILVCFLSKRVDGGEEGPKDSSVSLYSSLTSLSKSVITPLLDVRMLLIIPLIAYSGLQQAFVWAEFTEKIATPALGVSGVGGSMAVYGAFDTICSLTAGRLTSGIFSITWIVSAGLFLQAVVFLWILLKYSLTSGVLGIVYPLLMAAMLGIGDGVINTQLSALLGILFKHDTEGAFAQLKVWQSASIAVVFFINPYISLQVMVEIMLAALFVAAGGFLDLSAAVFSNPLLNMSLPFTSLRHRLSWPLILYSATWTSLLTLTVAVASFSPEIAFVSTISSFSQGCEQEGTIRVPLDVPGEVMCLPAHLFKRSTVTDSIVSLLFAALVVAVSAWVVRAMGLWEDDEATL